MKNNLMVKRSEMHLYQEDAALLSGISREQWNRIESGKCVPGLITALLMAQALNCNVEDLFELESDDIRGRFEDAE